MTKLSIKDVIDLEVGSTFYEEQANEIAIEDYYLTRLTPTTLDIQVIFSYPKQITQTIKEPDYLFVRFTNETLFIDEQDF